MTFTERAMETMGRVTGRSAGRAVNTAESTIDAMERYLFAQELRHLIDALITMIFWGAVYSVLITFLGMVVNLFVEVFILG